jgi:AcrR family transcriptional regulator
MNKQIESVAEMAEGAVPARPLGVRAAGKARTRQRLIDSARRLFMDRGYEGATVRDIAAEAGLSTGAVFASFADKTELFNAVLQADSLAQIDAMEKASAEPGGVRERLVRTLSAAYGFQLGQIELLRAALAVSWSQGLSGDLGDRPIRKPAVDKVRELLAEGAAKGELRDDCDVDFLTETIWDCFVGNYRLALFGGQGVKQLGERLERQIELIMQGAQSQR